MPSVDAVALVGSDQVLENITILAA